MFKTQPYQNKIHVFHVTNGKLWTFKNDLEACKYTDHIQSIGTVGVHFKTYIDASPYSYQRPHYEYYDIILRDDNGDPVTIQSLIALWHATFRKKRKSFTWNNWHKHHHYRSLRRLKTTNERRQSVENHDSYDEYGIVVKPRGRRNVNNLPDSWDDYRREYSRCWKNQRKHQWVDKK